MKELLGTGNFLRSAEMEYVSLMMQEHLAHDVIERLGELGCLQLTDMNGDTTAFKRHYTPLIRSCDEMEKKLRFFEEECAKHGVEPETYSPGELAAWLAAQRDTLSREARGTTLLEYWEQVINDRFKDYQAIKAERDKTAGALYAAVQRRHVIERAGDFFLVEAGTGSSSGSGAAGGSSWNEAAGIPSFTGAGGASRAGADVEAAGAGGAAGASGDASMAFRHVAGIVATSEKEKFARIVFRASSGHAVVRFADIPGELVDEEGVPQAKTVFAIFYRGRSLVPKLDRICTAFGAHQHDIPNFAHEGEVAAALAETRSAISDALAWLQQERATSSSVLRHLSLLLRKWSWGVGREKAVCHALNLAARSPERGTITAQGWALKTSVGDVKAALTDVHTAAAQGGRLQPFFFEVLWAPTPGETTPPPGLPTPPTHFKTNRITGVFQGIINTYGMPRYREANPALWTLATFPFLFGVMYGDIGHGTLLLLGAAWMVWREKEFLAKPLGEMFGMAFKGRYMLLMMGFFGMYCGFLYNDFFAAATNIFGTKWSWPAVNGTISPQAVFTGSSHNDIYPFGMDPAWRISDNELLMYNSLKMKMSVIMGISQMVFGICLKISNALYFRSKLDLWAVAIPQLIFMVGLFGYMCFLIVYKWSVNWRGPSPPCAPPSIIDVMINLALKPGVVPLVMYPGQAALQQLILLTVFFCVPIMLIVKPVVVNRNNKKAAKLAKEHGGHDGHEQSGLLKPGAAPAAAGAVVAAAGDAKPAVAAADAHAAGGHGGGGHDSHGFGEMFIHSAIETIEFVLGSVSNTASYLRLWALSLAHSQLADVFWTRALVSQIETAGPGPDGTPASPLAPLFIVIGYGAWAAMTMGVLMLMDVLECFLHVLRLHWVEFDSKFFYADGVKFVPFDIRNGGASLAAAAADA